LIGCFKCGGEVLGQKQAVSQATNCINDIHQITFPLGI
jgi:hypothetical protein